MNLLAGEGRDPRSDKGDVGGDRAKQRETERIADRLQGAALYDAPARDQRTQIPNIAAGAFVAQADRGEGALCASLGGLSEEVLQAPIA